MMPVNFDCLSHICSAATADAEACLLIRIHPDEVNFVRIVFQTKAIGVTWNLAQQLRPTWR